MAIPLLSISLFTASSAGVGGEGLGCMFHPSVLSPLGDVGWEQHRAAPRVSAAVLILKSRDFLLLFLFPGAVMIHSWEVWKIAPGFLNLCNSCQET